MRKSFSIIIEILIVLVLTMSCFDNQYENTNILDSKISPDGTKIIVLQEALHGATVANTTEVYIADLKSFESERICGAESYYTSIEWIDNSTILINNSDILKEDVYEKREEVWGIKIVYTG